MNKKGFTLIEVISVIIIIGIIMIIAVPNVTQYITSSRKGSYATDIHAYIESIRAEYEGREYGPLLDKDELMIVPIEGIILEKGDSGKSPFAEYDYERSYVVIVNEKGGYQFYANVVDKANYGVVMTPYNLLDKDAIQENVTGLVKWSAYNGTTLGFTFNNKTYKWIDDNRIPKNTGNDSIPVLVLCEE